MTQRQTRFVIINKLCIYSISIYNYAYSDYVFLNPSVFYSIFMHLQKLYIVCDVALFVIANKSTSCHLDSPKDPVLPSKFFTPPDKVTIILTIHSYGLHVTSLQNSFHLFLCTGFCQ